MTKRSFIYKVNECYDTFERENMYLFMPVNSKELAKFVEHFMSLVVYAKPWKRKHEVLQKKRLLFFGLWNVAPWTFNQIKTEEPWKSIINAVPKKTIIIFLNIA